MNQPMHRPFLPGYAHTVGGSSVGRALSSITSMSQPRRAAFPRSQRPGAGVGAPLPGAMVPGLDLSGPRLIPGVFAAMRPSLPLGPARLPPPPAAPLLRQVYTRSACPGDVNDLPTWEREEVAKAIATEGDPRVLCSMANSHASKGHYGVAARLAGAAAGITNFYWYYFGAQESDRRFIRVDGIPSHLRASHGGVASFVMPPDVPLASNLAYLSVQELSGVPLLKYVDVRSAEAFQAAREDLNTNGSLASAITVPAIATPIGLLVAPFALGLIFSSGRNYKYDSTEDLRFFLVSLGAFKAAFIRTELQKLLDNGCVFNGFATSPCNPRGQTVPGTLARIFNNDTLRLGGGAAGGPFDSMGLTSPEECTDGSCTIEDTSGGAAPPPVTGPAYPGTSPGYPDTSGPGYPGSTPPSYPAPGATTMPSSTGIRVIELTQPGCGKCAAAKPAVMAVNATCGAGQVFIEDIDATNAGGEGPSLLARYMSTGGVTPTFLFLGPGGTLLKKLSGPQAESTLRAAIAEVGAACRAPGASGGAPGPGGGGGGPYTPPTYTPPTYTPPSPPAAPPIARPPTTYLGSGRDDVRNLPGNWAKSVTNAILYGTDRNALANLAKMLFTMGYVTASNRVWGVFDALAPASMGLG